MGLTTNVSVEKNDSASTKKKKKTCIFNVETPKSNKRKFVKTPHPLKSINVELKPSNTASKKRKLSFSLVGKKEDNIVKLKELTDANDSDPGKSEPTVKKKKLLRKNSPSNNSRIKRALDLQKKNNVSSPKSADISSSNNIVAEEPFKKKKKSKAKNLNTSAVDHKNKKLSLKPSATSSESKLTFQRPPEKEIELHKNENTIFIGNLPCDVTKKDIFKLFKPYGKVLSFRIRCSTFSDKAKNRKQGTIKKAFKEGSTVCGYVKFENLEGAQNALQMNGYIFKNHHMRVDMQDPRGRKPVDRKLAIFVSGLPKDINEDDLWEFFKECGDISSTRLLKDTSYLNKGRAYVNFKTADAVELALKLHEMDLKGKPVMIGRCSERIQTAVGGKKQKTKKQKKQKLKSKINEEKEQKTDEFYKIKDYQGNTAKLKKKKKPLSVVVKKKKKIAKMLGAK